MEDPIIESITGSVSLIILIIVLVGIFSARWLWVVISRLKKRVSRLEALVEQRLGVPQPVDGEITREVSRAPETATPTASLGERPVPSSTPPAPQPLPEVARRRRCPVCGYESAPDASECDSCRYAFEPSAAVARAGGGRRDLREVSPPAAVAQPPRAAEPPATPATWGPPQPVFGTWNRRICEQMAGEEWEAVIGGNWLNKLGVLVLVIGVALFVAYSIKMYGGQLGPAGRIAVGLAISLAMLVGGAALERKPRYVIFGRGLLSGGWAGLYFTTYAAYGIEAARIIQNPLLATVLLMAVAAGMIVHSLRYRSQAVTGLAYFVGYATLIVTPVTAFALAASVPLAGSLLFVAYQLSWDTMAVAGLVATYGGYAFAPEAAHSSWAGFVIGQSVLAIYWLFFDGFDLLVLLKRRGAGGVTRTVFPLNTSGFVGVSLLRWSAFSAATVYLFLAAAAAAFLLDTILRWKIQPPSSFGATQGALARAARGGYEASVTLAVGCATIAIFERFSGLSISLVLLLEAQMLVMAGLSLGQPYLQSLGGGLFVLLLAKLVLIDSHAIALGARHVQSSTTLTLLTAAVLYLNRMLLKDAQPSGYTSRSSLVASQGTEVPWEFLLNWALLKGRRRYGYAGCLLLIVILAVELPQEFLGLGWLVLAGVLVELGLYTGQPDFRLQAYTVGLLGFFALVQAGAFGLPEGPTRRLWVSLAIGTLITYGTAARLFAIAPDRVAEEERLRALYAASAAGTILASLLFWYILPSPLVAVSWALLGLFLIEAGFSLPLQTLRLEGYLAMALSYGRLFLANFTAPGQTAGISHRMLTVVPIIASLYYLSGRLHAEENEVRLGEAVSSTAKTQDLKLRTEEKWGRLGEWEHFLSRLCLYAAAFAVVVLIRFELGRVLAVTGWSLFGLALLVVGLRWRNRDLRWQSYLLAWLTFARSWATNFYIPESLAGVSGRVATGVIVIGCMYAAEMFLPRQLEEEAPRPTAAIETTLLQFEAHARTMFSLLATTLLAMLLFYDVSGSLLTVAWGLEGTSLLVAGFVARERVMRLSGLTMLGVCILKVFAYDLRQLEALPRIASFIVLGLLLLGVSLVYTRFREQLRRYL